MLYCFGLKVAQPTSRCYYIGNKLKVNTPRSFIKINNLSDLIEHNCYLLRHRGGLPTEEHGCR